MASLARSIALALVSAAVAGCSASTLPDAYVEESASLRASASDPPYTFFLVSRAGDGYVASALGMPFTSCLDGSIRAACPFGAIDLGLLGLAGADAQPILDAVTTDPSKATLVFVGAFERRTTLRASSIALAVQEIWRAPALGSVRATDAWYHVSHGGQQGLAVNRWQRRTVASLDLSAAPWMSTCDPDANGNVVCAPSQDGVLEDAEAPAGILVDGWLGDHGILHVRQYLAKIGVGEIHAANGYWYCRADQVACANGRCAPTADACEHEGFHGGGSVYVRTSQLAVQPWLVSTTQLTAAESSALQHPNAP